MSTLTVIAKIKAKPQTVETVKQELAQLISPTRDEQGCVDYVLHQDLSDPSIFIFYENWQSEADLDRHMASDHFKACFDKIGDMLEGVEVNKLTAVGD